MDTCPICQGSDLKIFKEKITSDYDLIECRSCTVISALPFQAPESAFYTDAVDVSSKERHTELNPFLLEHPARKCPQLQQGSGKRLLDIGCGNGSFASFASEKGFGVTGIDIDKTSLAGAVKRNLGNTTFTEATLQQFAAQGDNNSGFDIITMFEVFEHLDNPNETIALIHKLLKPGGYFIGSMPNIGRLWMWKYHMNYEVPPYHLTYWRHEAWKQYTEAKGFKLLSIKNNIYHGYVSDILRTRYQPKKGTLLSYTLALTKRFVEEPAEKILGSGASFLFILQKQ